MHPVWVGGFLEFPADGFWRILQVERGTLEAGGLPAGVGDLLLIPPAAGRTRLAARQPSRLLLAEVDPRFLDHPDFDRWRDRMVRLFDPGPVIRVSGSLLPGVRDLLLRLEGGPEVADPGAGEIRRLRLAELLLLLARVRPGPAGDGRPASPPAGAERRRAAMEETAAWLQAHYTDAPSLSCLAARHGLSPAYFSRLFRQVTGAPVFEYLNRLRVKKACGLLKRTDLTVLEIALAVGYNNVSFFNRYFRRVMNRSPREYRRLLQR